MEFDFELTDSLLNETFSDIITDATQNPDSIWDAEFWQSLMELQTDSVGILSEAKEIVEYKPQNVQIDQPQKLEHFPPNLSVMQETEPEPVTSSLDDKKMSVISINELPVGWEVVAAQVNLSEFIVPQTLEKVCHIGAAKFKPLGHHGVIVHGCSKSTGTIFLTNDEVMMVMRFLLSPASDRKTIGGFDTVKQYFVPSLADHRVYNVNSTLLMHWFRMSDRNFMRLARHHNTGLTDAVVYFNDKVVQAVCRDGVVPLLGMMAGCQPPNLPDIPPGVYSDLWTMERRPLEFSDRLIAILLDYKFFNWNSIFRNEREIVG